MNAVFRTLKPLLLAWFVISPALAQTADTLSVNQKLVPDQGLVSADNRFVFKLQGDGNVVLRTSGGEVLWTSGTGGSRAQSLNMQSDGNLVLRNASGPAVWASGTDGSRGVKLIMQTDGNVVMRTASGSAVWQTGTGGRPPSDTVKPVITLNGSASMWIEVGSAFTNPSATASDDKDGNITSRIVMTGNVNPAVVGTYTLAYDVKDAAGNAATTVTRTVEVKPRATPALGDTLVVNQSLPKGTSMYSSNRAYALVLADGNLVVWDLTSQKITWSTGTAGSGAENLFMQSDGNLVLRTAAGAAVWASGTHRTQAAKLVMQSDGNLVLYTASNGFVWNTGIGGQQPTDTVKPVITLNGSANISVVQGSAFTNPGATASDDKDGNITNRIVMTGNVNPAVVGTYTLSYDVKDTAGNAATTVTRTVNVTATSTGDVIKPVIMLNGSASVSVEQGKGFTDLGATASDNRDGNITSRIVVSGSVNTAVVGGYTLSYNVRDAAGNAADTVTRSVTVTSANTGTKITLPIEVLGPARTAVDVPVNLTNAAAITHLYLRCNSCGHEDIADNRVADRIKATVRINNGPAIALQHFTEKDRALVGNRDITVIGGEAKYGSIGGSFRTARFTVKLAANQLRNGANTLRFEHQTAIAPSIGYRIIDLNFIENNDINRKVLVTGRDLVMDDPMTWKAPRPNDVAAGAALWGKSNILYDPLIDLLDGRGGKQGNVSGNISASCAACHTKDGRDLKFFNFSNHSIVERSKFHGLTQEQGEQIASYIRVNPAQVTRRAWPWNPAYQPGPGLDSNSTVYEWAAGAGIDAVLDDDKDMAKYIFPGRDDRNVATLDEVRKVVNRFGTLNFRELPINIPMPEWNQWLPVIHPDDAFNVNDPVIRRGPNGQEMGGPFYTKIVEAAMANPTFDSLAFVTDLKPWLQRGMSCMSNGLGANEPWRGLDGNVIETMILPRQSVNDGNCTSLPRENFRSVEYAKRGLSAWATVKMWEIMHTKSLEEASKSQGTRVCIGGTCVNGSEVRGWHADGRNVFDRPPHFTAVDRERKFLHQNAAQGIFESNQWYHLNMILNPGYKVVQSSHFAYTYSHVELLHQFSGVSQGFRFWATMIKQRQLQTTGKYGIEAGLDLRTAQPYVYYGTSRDNPTNTRTQSAVGRDYWRFLATAMIEDLVGDARNANWNQHWSKATRNSKVQSPSSSTGNFKTCGSRCEFVLGDTQGSNTYKVIPLLKDLGVEKSAINSLIDWSKTMWPNGEWEDLRQR